MTLAELTKRSNDFVKNIDKTIIDVCTDNPYLIDLNKKQLKQSKLKTGGQILPLYSRQYAMFKGFEKPDLRLSGDFYGAMFLKVTPKEYTISSLDPKTLKLEGRYSPDIFGISKENEPFAQKITTSLIGDIYKKEVLK
jgi:hypothetical protein